MANKHDAPSRRATFKRGHKRGTYDRQIIYSIIDAMPICHVAYVFEGNPIVTPTNQWREGDYVYWHGSSASRMMRAATNAQVCMSIAILDGMVMARSAFNHSVNYRSVMLFGEAELISDPAQAQASLEQMIDAYFPGRSKELRPMKPREVKATALLRMPINEATAKIRTGMPVDEEDDYDWPVWAGVLPVSLTVGEPQPDPRNLDGADLKQNVSGFKIG